jgi:hypothetical protein
MDDDTADPDRPDWLPEAYDPDAPLRERLPIIAAIDGGIELHVADQRGTVEVVGSPKHFSENSAGAMTLDAGRGGDDSQWSWEITVPAVGAGEPVLRRVDPEQDFEDYEATKQQWFTGLDVRIYGIDADRIEEAPA